MLIAMLLFDSLLLFTLILYIRHITKAAFDIDEICWFKIRDKILKDRYAGVQYSMADSFSPIIINHRGDLPLSDRHAIAKLFPFWIRVEFQKVDYTGERTHIYGRGDMLTTERIYEIIEVFRRESEYRENHSGEWKRSL